MGVIIFFEVESGGACPYDFTKSQGRQLFEYAMEYQIGVGNLPNVIRKIEEHLGLNLLPITKFGSPESEYVLEEYDMDEERFNEALEESSVLWQPPQDLINCIQALLKALNERHKIFVFLKITDEYFINNIFQQDLVDLLKMAEWARENGEKKVHLSAA